MKMKRYLCLALVVVFTLAIALTGCGGSDNATSTASTAAVSSDAAATTPTEVSSDVPKDTVDLSWYLVGPQQDPDVDMICQKASEYLKDKLNVNLHLFVFSYGDAYNQKVNAMLQAGEPFDVCFTASWAADYRNNAQSGYFLPLDDYLAKSSAIKDIDGEAFLNSGKINGKIYAVNTNKEQAHQWGFLLKKDLCDKYGVDASKITKMEDLESVFEKIKKGEPGVYPLLPVQMDAPFKFLDWDTFSDDDVPGALYPDNSKTTVVNQFTAPESIAHYKKMQEYYKKGWIPADAATMEGQVTLMTSGKYFANSSSMKPGKDAEMKASTGGIDWVQVNLTPPVKSNREAGGSMLAIPAKSKNPDRAFKFIEMLYTDKTLRNMFSFGLEGVHYDKVSDNVIKLKADNKGYTSAGNGWRFGDQFKDYLMDNEDPQKWEKFKQFNDSAIALNSLGFAFDKTNVDAEVSACKSVVQNYYKQLFTGSVKDVDAEVAKFDKDLKAAGVEKLIKEMQTQYDAFLAANK